MERREGERMVPKRSAIAPANGWAAPHKRFWIATAKANTSRPTPSSALRGWGEKPKGEGAARGGWRKTPRGARAPKVRIAIRPPHAMITTGVRQPKLGVVGTVVAISS